jgi:hypothetical protein
MTFSTDPIFAPLPSPVSPADVGYAPAHLGAASAQTALRQQIAGRFAAPADALSASECEEPRLLWMPFWRVQLSLEGFDVQLGSVGVGRAPVQVPVPWVRSRSKEAVILVRGRSAFGYEARLPSWWRRNVSGTPMLELGMEEVVPRAGAALEGEIVDADATRDDAERAARRLLEEAVRPSGAVFASYEAKTLAANLVLYPLYFARYRYRGEASRVAVEDCWVAISARTGKPVAAKHPSALRSTASKLRRLLTSS